MTCDRCDECRMNGDRFCKYCGEILETRPVGCPRCGESAQKGHAYCIYCGRALANDVPPAPVECTRCEESRQKGYKYCIYCGKTLERPIDTLLNIGFIVGAVAAFVILGLILFEYGVAIWGIPSVYENIQNATCSLILVIPQVYEFFTFSGTGAQVFYLLLIAAVTVSLFFFIYKAVNPVKRLFKDNDRESIKNTAFFEVAVLFGALTFLEIIFSLILTACGQSLGELGDRPTWAWLYSLLEASVWEELITRVLYLGVPVLIIALITKKKEYPFWRYLVGGFGFNKTVLVFILFSSIMFAAGHLTNWTVWKFFPTFLAGIILAYLFCKYGLYASIMFHFLTDYISAESWLLGTSSAVMTSMVLIMIMFTCAPYNIVYIRRGFLYLKNLFFPSEKGL